MYADAAAEGCSRAGTAVVVGARVEVAAAFVVGANVGTSTTVVVTGEEFVDPHEVNDAARAIPGIKPNMRDFVFTR